MQTQAQRDALAHLFRRAQPHTADKTNQIQQEQVLWQ